MFPPRKPSVVVVSNGPHSQVSERKNLSQSLVFVVQDETEARIVHRTLTELVEQQDPSLLGANLGQVRHDQPANPQYTCT